MMNVVLVRMNNLVAVQLANNFAVAILEKCCATISDEDMQALQRKADQFRFTQEPGDADSYACLTRFALAQQEEGGGGHWEAILPPLYAERVE